MKSHTQTRTFIVSKEVLFTFLSDIHNLPKWATEFAQEIREVNGKFKVLTPDGEMFFRIESDQKTGIIDMYCGDYEDKMNYFPSRVIELPDKNSAYHITNFQWAGITDKMFTIENEILAKELENISYLLESN